MQPLQPTERTRYALPTHRSQSTHFWHARHVRQRAQCVQSVQSAHAVAVVAPREAARARAEGAVGAPFAALAREAADVGARLRGGRCKLAQGGLELGAGHRSRVAHRGPSCLRPGAGEVKDLAVWPFSWPRRLVCVPMWALGGSPRCSAPCPVAVVLSTVARRRPVAPQPRAPRRPRKRHRRPRASSKVSARLRKAGRRGRRRRRDRDLPARRLQRRGPARRASTSSRSWRARAARREAEGEGRRRSREEQAARTSRRASGASTRASSSALELVVDHFRKDGQAPRVELVSGYRPKSTGSYHSTRPRARLQARRREERGPRRLLQDAARTRGAATTRTARSSTSTCASTGQGTSRGSTPAGPARRPSTSPRGPSRQPEMQPSAAPAPAPRQLRARARARNRVRACDSALPTLPAEDHSAPAETSPPRRRPVGPPGF